MDGGTSYLFPALTIARQSGAGTNAGGTVQNYYTNDPKLTHQLVVLDEDVTKLTKAVNKRNAEKAHITKQREKATLRAARNAWGARATSGSTPHSNSRPTQRSTKTKPRAPHGTRGPVGGH